MSDLLIKRLFASWAALICMSTTASAMNISVEETARMVAEDSTVLLLDIREGWERQQGHIPGTVHLPMGEIGQSLHNLPRDRTIILTCRTGNRTGQVTRALRQHGFDNVWNMDGGIVAWGQAGLDVVIPGNTVSGKQP